MTVKKIFKWILIAGIFALASCNGGGSDIGSGTIRIVSGSPSGPYTEGTSEAFTIVVAYTMADADDAEIVVGFGYQDNDGSSTIYHSATEVVGPTDSEVTKTFSFTKSLIDYTDQHDDNIFKIILKPYPVEGTYTPYDSETVTITVTPPPS